MPPRPRPVSLARRALPALALTGASGALIALLDRPAAPGAATAGASPTAPPAAARASQRPSRAGGDDQPPDFAPASTSPRPTTGPAASCAGNVVDGPPIETRWGTVQVAVTVAANGTVCDVAPLQYPNDNRRSLAINQRALPVLHDRAVRAGTGFDAVSGATVTSEGYRASLQAALDH